jgi:hypothetical protein
MSTPSNPAENEQKKISPAKKTSCKQLQVLEFDFYDPFSDSAETSNQTC